MIPERSKEVDELIKNQKIHFVPETDSPKIKFCVDPNGVITVYTKALTRLWATTYAHFRLYDYAQRINALGRYVSFSEDKHASEAASLLAWAVKLDHNVAQPSKYYALYSQYPGNSLQFFGVKDGDVLGISAQAISVFSIGYILLHEIAHLELKHAPSDEVNSTTSIQQEYEADMWAARFVMSGIDKYCKQNALDRNASRSVFDKRLLSILACNYWLVIRECYEGVSKKVTHPPMFERLRKIVCEFVVDDNHLAWAMTSVILSLHLQRLHKGAIPNERFNTFREYVEYCMDYISRISQ